MRCAPLVSLLFYWCVPLPALAEEPGVPGHQSATDSAEAPRPKNKSSVNAGDVDAQPAAEDAPQVGETGQTEPMKVHLEETPADAPPTTSPSAEPRPAPVIAPRPQPSPLSTMEERMRLRDEIDYLEDERDDRYSLGGPIAIMSVGGGLTIGGLVLLAQGAVLKSTASVGGSVTSGVANTGSTLMALGATGLAVGGGFVIGGGVWLGKRIEKRGPYNEQIDALEEQIDYYGAVELAPMVENGSLGLALSGVF